MGTILLDRLSSREGDTPKIDITKAAITLLEASNIERRSSHIFTAAYANNLWWNLKRFVRNNQQAIIVATTRRANSDCFCTFPGVNFFHLLDGRMDFFLVCTFVSRTGGCSDLLSSKT